MTGQPAARITDKVAKGVIVTGSATVLIGSQGGLACSVCPGGVTVANPVNPQLGAKVLVGGEDLDFALPGALPVVWQRQYSSYVSAEHGVACGLLGYGWKLPQQISVELRLDACLLLDAAGRVITFDPLVPGPKPVQRQRRPVAAARRPGSGLGAAPALAACACGRGGRPRRRAGRLGRW